MSPGRARRAREPSRPRAKPTTSARSGGRARARRVEATAGRGRAGTARGRPPRQRSARRARTPTSGRPRRGLLRALTRGNRPYALALVGLVCLLAAMAAGPMRSFDAAVARVDALSATRDQLRVEVDRLEERRERLNDPEHIELLARGQLGLVKPGEVPFVVVTPEPDVDELGPDQPDGPDGEAWHLRLRRLVDELLD